MSSLMASSCRALPSRSLAKVSCTARSWDSRALCSFPNIFMTSPTCSLRAVLAAFVASSMSSVCWRWKFFSCALASALSAACRSSSDATFSVKIPLCTSKVCKRLCDFSQACNRSSNPASRARASERPAAKPSAFSSAWPRASACLSARSSTFLSMSAIFAKSTNLLPSSAMRSACTTSVAFASLKSLPLLLRILPTFSSRRVNRACSVECRPVASSKVWSMFDLMCFTCSAKSSAKASWSLTCAKSCALAFWTFSRSCSSLSADCPPTASNCSNRSTSEPYRTCNAAPTLKASAVLCLKSSKSACTRWYAASSFAERSRTSLMSAFIAANSFASSVAVAVNLCSTSSRRAASFALLAMFDSTSPESLRFASSCASPAFIVSSSFVATSATHCASSATFCLPPPPPDADAEVIVLLPPGDVGAPSPSRPWAMLDANFAWAACTVRSFCANSSMEEPRAPSR
mmetsp:Transcript_13197/g.36202  ORF Transcript_13197/g.36202 Transcript_13197/m.36202 type:complete len:461 (-) Transcript_13197:92-1474(-)